MEVKDVLDDLGIKASIQKSTGNAYVIDLSDSDDFGRYYSLLEKADGVEELSESSLLTLHNASLAYVYNDYQLTLIADYDQDTYKLVITKI